uniref:Uncharacterized protein n=1 Tax=Anguilla anguilla TaxID=7936 RepID=A0A0E9TJP7_ANGAN
MSTLWDAGRRLMTTPLWGTGRRMA